MIAWSLTPKRTSDRVNWLTLKSEKIKKNVVAFPTLLEKEYSMKIAMTPCAQLRVMNVDRYCCQLSDF